MPDTDKPEKLVVTGTGYANNQFTVNLEASFGIATAGENSSFEISTTVRVVDGDGNQVATLSGSAPVQKQRDDAAPGTSVPLVPQTIGWSDRTFSGQAQVTTSSELLKNGNSVANSQAERVDSLNIDAPR